MGTKSSLISCLILIFLGCTPIKTVAQKHNNHLSIGLDIGPTVNWQRSGFPMHFGTPIKGYVGIRKNGQLMVRSGFHYFPNLSNQIDFGIESLTRTAVPLVFGYRINSKDWYFEGGLGVAYDVILTTYKDPLIGREGDITMEVHQGIEFGKTFSKYEVGLAIYNQGSAPFNILFVGIKTMYRLGKKKKVKENWWEYED